MLFLILKYFVFSNHPPFGISRARPALYILLLHIYVLIEMQRQIFRFLVVFDQIF